MAITYTGSSSIATGTSTTPTVTGYAATAGNTLVFVVTSSGPRTASGTSDTQGGSWTEAVDQADVRSVHIIYAINHPGGTTDVSTTLSSSASWSAVVHEFSGGHQSVPVSDSDFLATTGTGTDTFSAPASGFSITAGDIAFCCLRLNLAKDVTPTSGWTEISSGSNVYYHAYWPVGSGSTNERGGGTHSSLTGDRLGGVASFAPAASAFIVSRPFVVSQAVKRAATF